ncbi:hypothetical protein CFC21_052240 [Triticum aestivum]|uniref:Uncharacterized protein n=3 Tax=Triticum TaxID=4564 RepID=A0A9R0VXD8_TRITD|nr:hypothetical protein CFC21_052240 [Triticum aestivum]VAH91085.1 unnamed protein product [Triticum turgidum subsp. durum]
MAPRWSSSSSKGVREVMAVAGLLEGAEQQEEGSSGAGGSWPVEDDVEKASGMDAPGGGGEGARRGEAGSSPAALVGIGRGGSSPGSRWKRGREGDEGRKSDGCEGEMGIGLKESGGAREIEERERVRAG